MKFLLRYTDLNTKQIIQQEIEAAMDVVCLTIPEQVQQDHGVKIPQLDVHVNSDAVIVESDGERVFQEFFCEIDGLVIPFMGSQKRQPGATNG